MNELLSTKTLAPPLRANVVLRERLMERLNAGLHPGRRLTVVSGPAGFGKTTLIRHWLDQASSPFAWLTLDDGDNDPSLFMRYLLAAVQQVQADLGQAALHVISRPQAAAIPALTSLVNEVGLLEEPLVIVLDDYHAITEPSIHAIPRFLVEHAPPQLHLVIATREDPPLPLPQLRARGELVELRQRDLRFSGQEAEAFFRQTMALDIPAAAVEALEARTEGWIAGLQLAGLALQGDESSEAEAFVSAFAGSDRYVLEYLVAEVLQRQPEPVQDFLRQTSILHQMSGALCDALTGRSDGQAMLAHLEAANLFVVALDPRREWYRYHRLFAELMRLSLPAPEQQRLHHRAAAWYEQAGYPNQAVRHALALGKISGDYADATRLIGLAAGDSLHRGDIQTVLNWLEALPRSLVQQDAALSAYYAWTLAFTGRMDEAGPPLSVAVQSADATVRGLAALLNGFQTLLFAEDYPTASDFADQALRLLPENEAQWRLLALWIRAEALERSAPMNEAVDAFRHAYETGRGLSNPIAQMTVEMSLIQALNHQAQRREALGLCDAVLERYHTGNGRYAPTAALLFSRLGMLYYEANDLEKAHQAHRQAITLSEALGLPGGVMLARGLAAPCTFAYGDADAALDALTEAQEAAAHGSYGDADWYGAVAARLRLLLGDRAAVRAWAAQIGYSPQTAPTYMNLDALLTYVRLLIGDGLLHEADGLLERVEGFVEERDLLRALLTVHILKALSAVRSGDSVSAQQRISQAIRMAAPEGYFRAFLDEDPQVMALVERVRAASPGFVDQLLAYAGIPLAHPWMQQPLIEPLSERELEILGMIAEGLNNREIADQLFIALGTVKTHINNIYGKLEVRSRTEAVAKARSLHLLT